MIVVRTCGENYSGVMHTCKPFDVRKAPYILLGLILCIWTLCTGSAVWPQEASSSAHIEALIKQLGTGNIKAEDAAKAELMQHPSPDALPILLKALPSSEATVRGNIIEILGAYKDPRKIPALIAHRDDPKVEPQLLELGKSAIPALLQSMPNTCEETADETYAAWVGRILGLLDQDGHRALLGGLASGESCRLLAARSGLNVPRPGPPMGPPTTEESDTEDAGRFLLVDAAGQENPIIRQSAVTWIRALENRGWPAKEYGEWPYFDYSQYLEGLIKTYQVDADAETRTEIARMLAMYPCVRVGRFMKAAVRSPSGNVRAIARKYLGQTPSAKTQ